MPRLCGRRHPAWRGNSPGSADQLLIPHCRSTETLSLTPALLLARRLGRAGAFFPNEVSGALPRRRYGNEVTPKVGASRCVPIPVSFMRSGGPKGLGIHEEPRSPTLDTHRSHEPKGAGAAASWTAVGEGWRAHTAFARKPRRPAKRCQPRSPPATALQNLAPVRAV